MEDPSMSHWASHCTADDLMFRAVCNTVAEPMARPVKRRVIERLAGSVEARRLFESAWTVARGSASPFAHSLTGELVKDPLWSTLVIEAIAAERRWKDLFSPEGFLGKADRLHALWEKCFGKDASTLAKVASAAIAGTASLGLAIHIRPEMLRSVTLPIEVQLKGGDSSLPVKFLIDSKAQAIPITFKGPDGATSVPLRFEASVGDKPLKLHLEADGKLDRTPAVALNLVAERLEQTNTSIAATASQLTKIVNLTSNGNSEGLVSRLGEVSSGVRELTSAFNDAVSREAILSKAQGEAVNTKLNVVAKTTVVPYRYRVAQLRPNTRQSVVLPAIDAHDEAPGSIKITLCAGKMDSGAHVELKIFDDWADKPCPSFNPTDRYAVGGDVPTPDNQWIATINSLDHHWYGDRSATVTLSPAPRTLSASTAP